MCLGQAVRAAEHGVRVALAVEAGKAHLLGAHKAARGGGGLAGGRGGGGGRGGLGGGRGGGFWRRGGGSGFGSLDCYRCCCRCRRRMLLLLLFVHSLSCWRGWGGGGRWGGRCGGTLLGIPYELCCLGQVLLGLGALLLRLLGVPMTLGAHAVGADVREEATSGDTQAGLPVLALARLAHG